MPAKPTPEQKLDASRLKCLFLTWQKARKESGLPSAQEDLADLLGFNQSSLSQYLNGRIPLNVPVAIKFSTLIGHPVSDFSPTLSDEIGRYASSADAPDPARMTRKASAVSVGEPDQDDLIAIKMVRIRVEAGFPGFEADEEFEDGGQIHIPRADLERENWTPQCLLAIKVRGESMLPVFADGDTIVINVADRKLISGEIYAVNCEGKPVVKQMVLDGQQWYMRSFNPKFDPVPYRTPDSDVIGRVVYQPGRIVAGRIE